MKKEEIGRKKEKSEIILHTLELVVMHVQLSSNCGLGCLMSITNNLKCIKRKVYSWLTAAQAEWSLSPYIKISLDDSEIPV